MKYDGFIVNLVDQLDNRIKIRLADGKVGWVLAENIEGI